MITATVVGIFVFLSTVNTVEYPLPIVLSLCVLLFGIMAFRRHEHLGLLDVDSFAMKSKLKHIPGSHKLIFTIIVILTVVISLDALASLFVIITLSFLTIYYSGVRPLYYFKMLKVPMAFIALSGIAFMLRPGVENSYFMFSAFGIPFSISKASQAAGVNLFSKAYGGLVTIYFLGLNTPMGDIITTLRKLRLPDLMIELMYLIYRYIFLLFDTFSSLNSTAALRGGYGDFSKTFKTSKLVATRLMNYSFLQAMDNYDAMESRLYGGKLQFLEPKKEVSNFFLLFGALYCMTLMLIILGGRYL